jgi:hypothetical protein
MDWRTGRGLQHCMSDLLAGKEIIIGKHKYFINGDNRKTKQGNKVYRVMQDNQPYAFCYYQDNSKSEIGMSSGWVVLNEIVD